MHVIRQNALRLMNEMRRRWTKCRVPEINDIRRLNVDFPVSQAHITSQKPTTGQSSVDVSSRYSGASKICGPNSD